MDSCESVYRAVRREGRYQVQRCTHLVFPFLADVHLCNVLVMGQRGVHLLRLVLKEREGVDFGDRGE